MHFLDKMAYMFSLKISFKNKIFKRFDFFNALIINKYYNTITISLLLLYKILTQFILHDRIKYKQKVNYISKNFNCQNKNRNIFKNEY